MVLCGILPSSMSWQEVTGPDHVAASWASPWGYLDLGRATAGFNRGLPRRTRPGTLPATRAGNNGEVRGRPRRNRLPTGFFAVRRLILIWIKHRQLLRLQNLSVSRAVRVRGAASKREPAITPLESRVSRSARKPFSSSALGLRDITLIRAGLPLIHPTWPAGLHPPAGLFRFSASGGRAASPPSHPRWSGPFRPSRAD